MSYGMTLLWCRMSWCHMSWQVHDAWCNTWVDFIFVITIIPNLSLLPCLKWAKQNLDTRNETKWNKRTHKAIYWGSMLLRIDNCRRHQKWSRPKNEDTPTIEDHENEDGTKNEDKTTINNEEEPKIKKMNQKMKINQRMKMTPKIKTTPKIKMTPTWRQPKN